MPRFLPMLLAVLAVLYGGYWFFGRSGIEEAAREALDRPGISYESLKTIGFPSRFDTTIEGVEAESRDGRIAWSAPFFQVFTLSYAPQNVIAIWPDRQILRVGDEVISISAERMRASARLGVSTVVPLRQATFEADDITLDGQAFARGHITRTLLAIRAAGGDAETGYLYDLFAEVTGLAPDAGLMTGALVADETGPATIRIDGSIALDQPIDRTTGPISIRRIDIRDAMVRWAGVTIMARGQIEAVGSAYTGTATLEASDSDRLIALLLALGLVTQDGAETLGRAFGAVAAPDGSVELPVELRPGGLSIAGLPVASIRGF